jgi:hypothetical protein
MIISGKAIDTCPHCGIAPGLEADKPCAQGDDIVQVQRQICRNPGCSMYGKTVNTTVHKLN